MKLMDEAWLYPIMDAVEMVCDALGREPHESVEIFHENMKRECLFALGELTGEDMSNYEAVDVDFLW